ncbi:hypothetical protein V8C26DRAFT_414683 [Trichoderma gracile]
MKIMCMTMMRMIVGYGVAWLFWIMYGQIEEWYKWEFMRLERRCVIACFIPAPFALCLVAWNSISGSSDANVIWLNHGIR